MDIKCHVGRRSFPFGIVSFSGDMLFFWVENTPEMLKTLKMMVSKTNLLFQGQIFRFHVNFRGVILFTIWKYTHIYSLNTNSLGKKMEMANLNGQTKNQFTRTPPIGLRWMALATSSTATLRHFFR